MVYCSCYYLIPSVLSSFKELHHTNILHSFPINWKPLLFTISWSRLLIDLFSVAWSQTNIGWFLTAAEVSELRKIQQYKINSRKQWCTETESEMADQPVFSIVLCCYHWSKLSYSFQAIDRCFPLKIVQILLERWL